MPDIASTTLGRSGLQASTLGLGTAPLARDYRDGNQEMALETIRHALARGITLFDSAPLYGSGLAETFVGRALEGVDRDTYLLSTKVGRLLVPQDTGGVGPVFDFARDGVLRSLESSLERLKTDRIDILHIHDPDNHLEQAVEEAFPALAELRAQGVIRAVGAGMNQWQALDFLAQHGDFDCFLLAGRYTLLEQGALDFLDRCRERGIGILLGGVFNSGILAVGSVPEATYNYHQAPPDILERARALEAVCRDYDTPLSTAALRFSLTHPGTSALVVGAVHPDEVDANIESLTTSIPAELWQRLRGDGLIDAAAPTPAN